MFEKYVMREDEIVLAIMRNDNTKITTIGGKAQDRDFMEKFIKEYFRKFLPKRRYTQTNKIRYNLYMGFKTFHSALDRIREDGFDVTKVKVLGRIMR